MIDRIYNQMKAMQVLSKSQEITADNLANINTPGFKGNKVFYHLFTETIDGEVVQSTKPMQAVNLEQGILEPTGNEFDFGINGDGFFVVEANDQKYMTRDGRFHLDPDGFLVNGSGDKIQGESGPIQLNEYFQASAETGTPSRMEIAKDGTIKLNGKAVDRLKIVRVDDPAQLQRHGSAYFSVQDEDQMKDDVKGSVMQGYYEKGNVNPLNEMVGMMRNMQMFESQQRALRTTDDMLGHVTTRLGRF